MALSKAKAMRLASSGMLIVACLVPAASAIAQTAGTQPDVRPEGQPLPGQPIEEPDSGTASSQPGTPGEQGDADATATTPQQQDDSSAATNDGTTPADDGEAGLGQQAGPPTPVGAPVPSASYDPYQSQLGLTGIGVSGGYRTGLFNERGLTTQRSLDAYRSLARPSNRYRGTTVMERRRSDYDATGILAGGFTVYPAASLETAYTSNVLRQDNSVDDVYATGHGELLARSNWSRHQLILNAALDQRIFAKYGSENTTVYGLNAAGRIDVAQSVALFFSAAHEYDYTSRRSVVEFIQTRSPVRFFDDTVEAKAVVQIGRFTISSGGSYERKNYRNAQTPDGAPLNVQFRDHDIWRGEGELSYKFMPGRDVFVSLSHETRRFPVPSNPLRDVDVTEVLAGVGSDITPLIRGKVGVGYIWASFKGAGAETNKGLSVNAQLTYLASELTTFTLIARRDLGNVAIPNARAAFITRLGVEADHELLRNVVFSGEFSYRLGEYVGTQTRSTGYRAGTGVSWFINRYLSATGGVSYNWSHNNSILLPRQSDTFETRIGIGVHL